MAKTSAQTLITDLAKRLDLDSTDSTVRADLLRQLNISQREICQDHSLRFLITSANVTVTNGTAPVPSTIDTSKAITIGRPSGDGEVEYVPTDEWFRARVDLYGEPNPPTQPSHYTVAQVSGTPTFLFKPEAILPTGPVPYLAQLLVVDMTDAGGSTSVLPEGWEDTLLLDHAESEQRRILNEPYWQDLRARANDKKERLYSSYRTTKEQAMTDREQQERKVAKDRLSDEA